MADGGGAEVKRGRKFDQVIEGAHSVFMADGFEGASVDTIAKVAGVSKATLYSYFPDKRALFVQVAREACSRQTELAMSFVEEDVPFAENLYRGCRSFMAFLYSPFGMQMYRTMIGEAERFPKVGCEFWKTGPEAGQRVLIDVFREAVEEGELQEIEDYQLAAGQLMEMCKAHLHPRLLLGVIDRAEPEVIDRIVREAVRTFMARYGTEKGRVGL